MRYERLAMPFFCFGLLALTLAVCCPVMKCDFVNYDDDKYVVQNPAVQRGFTAETLNWAFSSWHASNWYPITWLSHTLDFQLFGLNPRGHHLVNLLLHAANTVLVFLLLYRAGNDHWSSALVAALFAAHPTHVESYAWISERKDVLSAMFGLLALLAYVQYTRAGQATGLPAGRCRIAAPGSELGRSGGKRKRAPGFWYGLSWLLLALGLMSKPMLVSLPFLMLALDFWQLQRWANLDRRGRFFLVLEKAPFLVLALASSVITILVQRQGGAMASLDLMPMPVRLGNAIVSFSRYLGKLFWPTNLAVLYPFNEPWPTGAIAASACLIALISVLAWKTRQTAPWLLTGWSWFVVGLLPVIGIVQVGEQSIADRYLYLPSLGVFVAVVWSLRQLGVVCSSTKPLLLAICALALGAAVLLTHKQIYYWRDSISLFEHAISVTRDNATAYCSLGAALLSKGRANDAITQFRLALRINPRNALAHSNLGAALIEQGRTQEAVDHYLVALELDPLDAEVHFNYANACNPGFLDGASAPEAHTNFAGGSPEIARQHYAEALRINPAYASAHLNWGNLEAALGQADAALFHYQAAGEINPRLAEPQLNRGNLLARLGRTNEALAAFEKAVTLDPNNALGHFRLANLLCTRGNLEQGIPHYERAIRLRPGDVLFHQNLALALLKAGRAGPAIEQYREALQINSNAVTVLNNLAWVLATHPRAEVRAGSEAVRLARRACDLTAYADPRILATLDAALAEAGDFAQAIEVAQKARELALKAGLADTAVKANARLERYQAGRPYHEP